MGRHFMCPTVGAGIKRKNESNVKERYHEKETPTTVFLDSTARLRKILAGNVLRIAGRGEPGEPDSWQPGETAPYGRGRIF